MSERVALPIDPALPEIVAALRRHGSLVLMADPGAGKTTRVAPALLAAGLAHSGLIVMLQPRRVAARAVASRIASEEGWRLGGEVGYVVRFDRRVSKATRIEIVTEGILTRRLQNDPFLSGVEIVILDEFHERSVHSDFALALLADIRRSGRQDLKVVVMSATLEPKPIAAFLDDAPILRIDAPPHEVATEYLERSERPTVIATTTAQGIRSMWRPRGGHVLAFLPGRREIERVRSELETFAADRGATIVPLHGGLDLATQELALQPSRTRKIILATNIAETSLTVDGVDTVVDSGYARLLRRDPCHGINRLELVRISRNSATQRAGRAARQGPGRALRLWTRSEHADLCAADPPEIMRVDLAALILELKSWGIRDPHQFDWFEPPPPELVRQAEKLLAQLGAITAIGGGVTRLGETLCSLPTHPRLGRLLLAAGKHGELRRGATLAALIEERDMLSRETVERHAAQEVGPSDLLLRLDLMEAQGESSRVRKPVEASPSVSRRAVQAIHRTREALLRSAAVSGSKARTTERASESDTDRSDEVLLRALLAAYPDRVARRRTPQSERARMVGGRGVRLARESIVRDAELFVAVDIDDTPGHGTGEALVRVASAIKADWLRDDFPDALRSTEHVWFDAESEKVRAARTLCYHDLPLEEPRECRPPPEAAATALREVVQDRGGEVFARFDAPRRFIARVLSLAEWMPELQLPALTDTALGELLAAQVAGKTALREFSERALLGILQNGLSHEQLAAVERYAPERLQVPSGSRIQLDYQPGKPPTLAVKLQELFGLEQTPTVAGGRQSVLLHLLAPNGRAVQVTQDLVSFWANTYAEVRKELRGRYPKHAWPERPLEASPTRGTRRRRS